MKQKSNTSLHHVYWSDYQWLIVLSVLVGAGAEERVDGFTE